MAGNYILLDTIQLTQSAATVTLDNIPQTGYTDLKVVVSARGTTAQVYTLMDIWFNGSTTGFSSRGLEGNGASATTYANPSIYLNAADGASATANTFSSSAVYIPNYTSNNFKTVLVDGVLETNAATAYASIQAGLWSNTAAVTSIEIKTRADVFVAGSSFSLYGIAKLNTTPVVAPKATGGNIITNDGTYWYHAFLTSGTFTPRTSLTCDLLVVGGGGGGGGNIGGGGGAGGLLAFTSQALTNSVYNATVGGGGAGVAYNATLPAPSGTDSQFGSLTASVGGGGGATYYSFSGGPGRDGGSGGGGQAVSNPPLSLAGGSGTSGQGNNGGSGSGGSGSVSGGGGGGKAAVGSNGTSTSGGAGGAGINTYTSWASATSTGASGYYAGGGGGAGNNYGTITAGGAGGAGGGGVGGFSSAPTSGAATTGGGGGGGMGNSGSGGNGGSGIIIIRYAMA